MPRPGSSPYPDHILHVHLTDLRSEEGTSLSEDQALVALYSMRDNIRLRPASYRPGQRIRVRLHNYEEISRTHHIETVKSSDLRGGAMYEIPCWGEDVSLSGGGNSSAPR